MRILIDMGHPAHVHCSDPVAATPTLVGGIFKNAIWESGHAPPEGARGGDGGA